MTIKIGGLWLEDKDTIEDRFPGYRLVTFELSVDEYHYNATLEEKK